VSSSSEIVISTLVWFIACNSSSIFSGLIPTPKTGCPPRARHRNTLRNIFLSDMYLPLRHESFSRGRDRVLVMTHNRNAVARRPLCVRSYLRGGGRGEKAGREENGSGLGTLETQGTGLMMTAAKKNQNGIKKATSRPSKGCVATTSKAIARHRKAISRDAERAMSPYTTPTWKIYNPTSS
jgi:hypothetical protein